MPKHRVNIYDFDHTIYNGDSTLDFYIFCIKKHPFLIIHIPPVLFSCVLFLSNLKSREEFKYAFYASFLPKIDTEALVKEFWAISQNKIKLFYLSQKKPTDIIITASPSFLIKHIADILDVRLIASLVDTKTGKLLSKNCRGREKVTRLEDSGLLHDNDEIWSVYTDSESDRHLTELAKNKYLISKNKISKFPNKQKTKNHFKSLDFIRFIGVGGINALVGISSASLLSLLIDPLMSFALGYFVSLIVGFVLMSAIVFNNNTYTLSKFVKYVIGYIPNFIIQTLVVLALYSYLGIYHIVAYCIATALAVPATFLILKLKIFTK